MSEKETQCRKLYTENVKFNENKKLAYLFSSKIFVKKLCSYLDDLGLISMEAKEKHEGFKEEPILGNIKWSIGGIYLILLDLSNTDKLDTDKWKDLVKSINNYYALNLINKRDYNNIIETVYNFKGWLEKSPKWVLDTILLYLKLGKVPDYTIWALWSLVDYTDKSKEKLFGEKTDKQLEENTEKIKEKFNNSIISLQEQQLRNLYNDKYLSSNPEEIKTTLDGEVYHDIDKIDKKFRKFFKYCKSYRGDNIDNISGIIKDFDYLYNEYESTYESPTKSPTKSPRSVSFFRTAKKGGIKKFRKTKKRYMK